MLSLLEEVVDFGKLSAVQFVPRGLIRLTFMDPVDKDRLVNQGSVMLDNVECSVTPRTGLTPWCMYIIIWLRGMTASCVRNFAVMGK